MAHPRFRPTAGRDTSRVGCAARDPSIVRYATGSTIKHVNLRNIELPILDPRSLAALDHALGELERLEGDAVRFLRSLGTYTEALLATLTAERRA